MRVVRGAERDYLSRHPGAADVALQVEVVDTSLEGGSTMARTYGSHGIAVYWLVNLREWQIEVYTEPAADGFRLAPGYKRGEFVPVVLDGEEIGRIALSDILP